MVPVIAVASLPCFEGALDCAHDSSLDVVLAGGSDNRSQARVSQVRITTISTARHRFVVVVLVLCADTDCPVAQVRRERRLFWQESDLPRQASPSSRSQDVSGAAVVDIFTQKIAKELSRTAPEERTEKSAPVLSASISCDDDDRVERGSWEMHARAQVPVTIANEKAPVPGSSVRLKLTSPETVVQISNNAVADGKNEDSSTISSGVEQTTRHVVGIRRCAFLELLLRRV